jgi:iron complex transport system substrate-binding protein
VVDNLNRPVTLPESVDRIISLEPEITRIIVALGEGDKLVGIDFFLSHHDHLFPLILPQTRDLPVLSNEGQDLNFETALALKPDVVFSSPSEFLMTEAMEKKLRAPVVALASLGKFENLLGEIEILGDVLSREDRARELISFFRSRTESLRLVLEQGAGESYPSVYLAFWGSFLRTPVSYAPVDSGGGINLASGLLPLRLGSATATVDLERVLLWNPEVILIHGNYLPKEREVTVEGVLNDPRLRSVRAVREKRVHYTFGFWYWWDPALVLLETEYIARLLHPGLFPDFDLESEGNRIFEKFYGVKAAFSDLSRILGCHDWIRP